jgi:hypothetical protein
MVDHELARPDPQPLDLVARMAGVDHVFVLDERLGGESGSTFAVAADGVELVVKLVPAARRAMDNQRRLIRLVSDLRRRGYPAPHYVGVGESGGSIFTVQRPCQVTPCTGVLACRPHPTYSRRCSLASLLPSRSKATRATWPSRHGPHGCSTRRTGPSDAHHSPRRRPDPIETGGDGYCLHATMGQSPRTAALLRRVQTLARRSRRGDARTCDVVHFDMNPANILHAGGRLSGVVDWNIPFDGAGQGDRGFDIATLLFYAYDLDRTRETLWERVLELSGIGWTTVYLCHLSLRQVEWSRRHRPASADEARFMAIADAVLDDCEAHGA